MRFSAPPAPSHPGRALKEFSVERKDQSTKSHGRVSTEYIDTPEILVKAVLAQAKPEEKVRWQQTQHPITHTIVQRGAPAAAEEDRLVLQITIDKSRYFYVQGVDDVGGLGNWTIYYAEERSDTGG